MKKVILLCRNKEGGKKQGVCVIPIFYRKIKKSYLYTQHEALLEGKWDQWISMETEGCMGGVLPSTNMYLYNNNLLSHITMHRNIYKVNNFFLL